MKIPFFGDLNTESLQNNYLLTADFEGSRLDLDLNFDNTSIDAGNLNQAVHILENLEKSVEKVNGFIIKEFQEGSEVDDYLTYHLEELPEKDLEILIAETDKNLSQKERLFSMINLSRIGFYPENEESYAVFDFALSRNFSDYLLVVYLDRNGELNHITMES